MNWPKILTVTFVFTTLLYSPVSCRGLSKVFSDAIKYSVGGRVIGGRDAILGEFPYQLQLRYDGSLICGATLVENSGKQMVVTAAHCVTEDDLTPQPADSFEVRGGVIGVDDIGQAIAVKTILVHPDYQIAEYGVPINDIAVIFPDGEFTYDDNVKPLNLPSQGQATSGEVVLSGWGYIKPNSREEATTLQTANLPVVDSDTCNEWHGGGSGINIIRESMLCAGYEDARKSACNGDSGGPAAGTDKGGYLAGVVSFGQMGCGRSPTVFTRVSSFVDWLNEVAASY